MDAVRDPGDGSNRCEKAPSGVKPRLPWWAVNLQRVRHGRLRQPAETREGEFSLPRETALGALLRHAAVVDRLAVPADRRADLHRDGFDRCVLRAGHGFHEWDFRDQLLAVE